MDQRQDVAANGNHVPVSSSQEPIVSSEASSAASNVAEASFNIDVQISIILSLQVSSIITEIRNFSWSSSPDAVIHRLEASLTLKVSLTVSRSPNHLFTASCNKLIDWRNQSFSWTRNRSCPKDANDDDKST